MVRKLAIEPITIKNALVFKEIRLRALRDSPTAFGSTYAQEAQLSDDEWLARAAACHTETTAGFLALDGPSAIGIARATPDDEDADVVWVESMWVAPTHRRAGVGRLLINQVIAWTSGRGARVLKLCVTSHNDAAIRFYQSVGFSPTGRTEPYPNDAALTECEMLRKLPLYELPATR